MKRILFITNFASKNECDNKITSFSRASYETAKKLGMEFHINTNKKVLVPDDGNIDVHYHYAGIYRNPFSKDVIKAYQELCEICRENRFDVIHCNTPIGGVLGRIVGKKYKVPKVIYQAHGFHFYKGAPLKNWLIYYPIERWLAHWTDAIITMNEEDYQAAKKFRLRKGGKVYKVHGVGITLDDFKDIRVDRGEKRKEFVLKATDIVCISAGDLVARKNYGTAIEALAKAENKNLHYLICGVGPDREKLEKLVEEKGVASRVHFLGFRIDVKELMKISDIFLFTTLQEGMPRSMMEAMACGLPCVASKIRGNVDLLDEGKGGYLREVTEVTGFSECLTKLANDNLLRKQMSDYNLEAIRSYNVEVVKEEIGEIYRKVVGE